MAGAWSNVADAYARSFAGLCAGVVPDLLTALAERPRLLDVGSGTGLLAAAALARGHEVTAVEPEPDLCALTRSAAPGARVVRAALPQLPLPTSSYDATTACFVVNHLGDPRAGLAELHRVLRPGAMLAATIWPPGPTRQGELFREVMRASGATDPQPTPPLAPELDFDRTAEGFATLLTGAGWTDVRTTTVGWTWRPTPDDFWAAAEGGVAGMGSAWKAQTPAVQARMREVLDDLGTAHLEDGRLVLPAVAVLGTACAYDQGS